MDNSELWEATLDDLNSLSSSSVTAFSSINVDPELLPTSRKARATELARGIAVNHERLRGDLIFTKD